MGEEGEEGAGRGEEGGGAGWVGGGGYLCSCPRPFHGVHGRGRRGRSRFPLLPYVFLFGVHLFSG